MAGRSGGGDGSGARHGNVGEGQNSALGTRAPAIVGNGSTRRDEGDAGEALVMARAGANGGSGAGTGARAGAGATTAVTTRAAAAGHTVAVNNVSAHIRHPQQQQQHKIVQNRREIIEEIVGEAGIMSYLRHPRILQLFGCSLTAQAIWIVSELCSQGSLRQVLDDKVRLGTTGRRGMPSFTTSQVKYIA